jgi:hypothetical protein
MILVYRYNCDIFLGKLKNWSFRNFHFFGRKLMPQCPLARCAPPLGTQSGPDTVPFCGLLLVLGSVVDTDGIVHCTYLYSHNTFTIFRQTTQTTSVTQRLL